MVHILLVSVSGVVLCGGMTLLADRFASEFFREKGDAGVSHRS